MVEANNEKNVLMIGQMGCGKSTITNMLVGTNVAAS